MLVTTLDRVMASLMGPCDLFIGMSGLALRSAVSARERFGAKVFLERGSSHIVSQQEILEAIPGTNPPAVSRFEVIREQEGYELADVISVPSRHVVQSFLERGVFAERLFRNPYGVDLDMFPPTPAPKTKTHTVIFVGTWSLRKGCDILWQACCNADAWNILHVGPIGDAPLPHSIRCVHHDPVPQSELTHFYSLAHVSVLASREEGLSLVQAQALASGLPLVCTNRSGGEDLRELLEDPEWITVVPHDDAGALGKGIARALIRAEQQTGKRNILGTTRHLLSWKAYGARYNAEILKRCSS